MFCKMKKIDKNIRVKMTLGMPLNVDHPHNFMHLIKYDSFRRNCAK